jgi:hypothetical protein
MVLADTGKTTPEDWKPMASFPHWAHAGFFARFEYPKINIDALKPVRSKRHVTRNSSNPQHFLW